MIYSQDRWWLTNSVTRFEEMSSLWQNFRSLWQVLIFKTYLSKCSVWFDNFLYWAICICHFACGYYYNGSNGRQFFNNEQFWAHFLSDYFPPTPTSSLKPFVRYFWIDFFAWECFSLNLSIGNNWRYGLSCFQTSKCCFSFCCCCFETKFSQKNQFLKNLPLTLDVVTTWSNNCLQLLQMVLTRL